MCIRPKLARVFDWLADACDAIADGIAGVKDLPLRPSEDAEALADLLTATYLDGYEDGRAGKPPAYRQRERRGPVCTAD